MEMHISRRLLNSKKILENLKSFLPDDLFKKANIMVERAINPDVMRAKYLYPVYKQLEVIRNKSDAKIEKQIFELFFFTFDGFDINMHYKILTAQEHYLIGSTPPIKQIIDNYTPLIYYFEPHIKNYKIKKLREEFLVSYTPFGAYFGFENNLKNKYYFLLENINKKNQTTLDPRPIDFEKLLNLMVYESKAFETASIDDIYNECKIKFKYSKDFPFKRETEEK
ncbi:MAG: hypothetical protein QXF48_02740 [Candidatus Anstonellaceae archaeon]